MPQVYHRQTGCQVLKKLGKTFFVFGTRFARANTVPKRLAHGLLGLSPPNGGRRPAGRVVSRLFSTTYVTTGPPVPSDGGYAPSCEGYTNRQVWIVQYTITAYYTIRP